MTPLHPIFRTCLLFSAVLLALSTLYVVEPLHARQTLERVSVAERSDGQGFVLRYHLSQRVDSFRVVQPETGLIQLALFSDDLNSENLLLPTPGTTFTEFNSYPFHTGFGMDIRLNEGQNFIARAYPDQNGRDLLLSLTRSTPSEMSGALNPYNRMVWEELAYGYSLNDEFDDYDVFAEDFYYDDPFYMQIRENLGFDTVVIDPGHGGREPGAIGATGTREKDVVLAIALKLGDYIREHMPDVNVVYTRDDDRFVGLAERGQIANRARGDLFVSIHANSLNPSARNRTVSGTEVWFLGTAKTEAALETMKRENSVVRFEENAAITELTNEQMIFYELANAGNMAISERLAEKMEYQFRERAGRNSRGVKQAGFMVLYHASMPAVLIEAGFISNPEEEQYLNSDYGQSIIASAIFRAIRDYRDEYERSRDLTRFGH